MASDTAKRTTLTRTDLARSEWRTLMEAITQDFQGSDVTIEILTPDLGDQPEAEKLPLAYVEYDHNDDVFIVALGGLSPRFPVVLRHMINHPQQIFADRISPEVPWVIDVVGADDIQTIVTLHVRPALPPPE
ncbi:MAG: hypothetical protein JWM47_2297 [Acidimicrobiales bacterium]|nr:hypothetical protein [Acidimicrobiales bacterium]